MDHDGESSTVAYASLIQTFNRYLLEQMTAESQNVAGSNPSLFKNVPDSLSRAPLAQLLRVEAKTVSVCQQCGVAASRETSLSVIDLVYPRRVSPHVDFSDARTTEANPPSQAMSNELPPASDYASLLRNSIHRETIARMVCPSCRQSNHLRIRRVLSDAPLPPVLVVNAGVRTSDELDIWVDGRQGAGTRFLGPRFEIGKRGDAIVIGSGAEGERVEGGVMYELRVRLILWPVLISSLTLLIGLLVAGDGRADSSGW
jgi:PAB-dependent poly(A)-specific ribonuclease subunit 2